MRLSFMEGESPPEKKYEHKPVMKRRRVVRIGNSFYINLPMAFVSQHRLKKGSVLAVIANDSVQVLVP